MRQRRRIFDIAVWTYRIIGLRERPYRYDAVESLNLKPGDTVVDLACGTGLNFHLLEMVVGKTGRIIGVDLTDPMLDRARKRVQAAGWNNVDLIEADIAQYPFPSEVTGILSTFAIGLVPKFDDVIENSTKSLRARGRMSIFDLKHPELWPDWMIRCTEWVNKPFGVSMESTQSRLLESVRRHLKEITFRENCYRYLYLCVGQAPKDQEGWT